MAKIKQFEAFTKIFVAYKKTGCISDQSSPAMFSLEAAISQGSEPASNEAGFSKECKNHRTYDDVGDENMLQP